MYNVFFEYIAAFRMGRRVYSRTNVFLLHNSLSKSFL